MGQRPSVQRNAHLTVKTGVGDLGPVQPGIVRGTARVKAEKRDGDKPAQRPVTFGKVLGRPNSKRQG